MTFTPPELPDQPFELAPGERHELTLAFRASHTTLEATAPLTVDAFELHARVANSDLAARALPLEMCTPLPERPHPRLFATAADLRAEARAHPDLKARAVDRADRTLARPMDVPEREGQWFHHYVCEGCGAPLKHEDDTHRCPACTREHRGWPYDEVIAGRRHQANWTEIRDLGLAYALTKDERYAARARELLLAYSERYARYPLHDASGAKTPGPGAARVLATTMDEARHIIGVAWGYDLIGQSEALRHNDHESIGRFLRQVAGTLAGNRASKYNEWAWHNAAFAAIGFCLGDEDLARRSLDRWSGLRYQLNHSVTSDGFWWEGALSYHFHALDAITWTLLAAENSGIELWEAPRVKALFDAPLRVVLPDGRLPPLNDSYPDPISRYGDIYRLAASRYGESGSYRSVLDATKRRGPMALLAAPSREAVPNVDDASTQVDDCVGLGVVALRPAQGQDASIALLKYGPHGGGHGHFDKLSLLFFTGGESVLRDPGTTMYGSPLSSEWFKQTIAHNTVSVDMKSQDPTRGRVLARVEGAGVVGGSVKCADAYPGVTMRRTTLLAGDALVDVFDLSSDTAHTYDYALQLSGELSAGFVTTPIENLGSDAFGYQHLSDAQQARVPSTTFTVTNATGRQTLELKLYADPPGVAYLTTGFDTGSGSHIAERQPTRAPTLVLRTHAQTGRFALLMQALAPAPNYIGLDLASPLGTTGPITVHLNRVGGSQQILKIATTHAHGHQRPQTYIPGDY